MASSFRTAFGTLALIAALLPIGCGGSDDGRDEASSATESSTTTASPARPIDRQKMERCLKRAGVKIPHSGTEPNRKLSEIEGVSATFTAKFTGKRFGQTVEDVDFLVFTDSPAAMKAHENIRATIGTERRTAIRGNLIAVFGQVRSHDQTVVTVDCMEGSSA